MNEENKLQGRRLAMLLVSCLILTIGLSWWLLTSLKAAEKKYTILSAITENQSILTRSEKILEKQKDSLTAAQLDSVVKVVKTTIADLATQSTIKTRSDSVTFYDILLMMLLAGSLGGVLCNFRGFFMHYRGEEESFPKNLEIPYYSRVFLGGGAGIFIYFVASFLITSVTPEHTATNISFSGMVTFIALSMLAGFGSLEFFQRLKETAMALFGQKAEKDKWQKLEDAYALWKKGVLTEDQYDKIREKLLETSSVLENFRGRDVNKSK